MFVTRLSQMYNDSAENLLAYHWPDSVRGQCLRHAFYYFMFFSRFSYPVRFFNLYVEVYAWIFVNLQC